VALPELTRKRVDNQLKAYCERRVPPHARDQVRMSYAIRGDRVTLHEERVAFDQPGTWIKIPIAQLRLSDSGEWALYCCDRNTRWFLYRHAEPARDIGALLGAMDDDKTGIFWG
jgi:pimeloyl-ACP methyl ester carboxylesterase